MLGVKNLNWNLQPYEIQLYPLSSNISENGACIVTKLTKQDYLK